MITLIKSIKTIKYNDYDRNGDSYVNNQCSDDNSDYNDQIIAIVMIIIKAVELSGVIKFVLINNVITITITITMMIMMIITLMLMIITLIMITIMIIDGH